MAEGPDSAVAEAVQMRLQPRYAVPSLAVLDLRIAEGPRLPQRLGDLAAQRIQDPEHAALQGDRDAEVPRRLTPILRDAIEPGEIQGHAEVSWRRVLEVSKLPLVPPPELAGTRDRLEPDLVLERWSDLCPPERSNGLILGSATPAGSGPITAPREILQT